MKLNEELLLQEKCKYFYKFVIKDINGNEQREKREADGIIYISSCAIRFKIINKADESSQIHYNWQNQEFDLVFNRLKFTGTIKEDVDDE